ncbi:glycosyltransferase family 1 protein [Dendrothele bispora CBS 962.96]|uniref:Glycosyltransferase family 1 protein n=1 Tax=Dendrothele bispora (strain CBS 962.96) TaxID=1314807 RepID=A0A4S8M952_DENBC|nr:glycosyltransferase family 1 protein [Dendrothele bispora CBS 962.96]
MPSTNPDQGQVPFHMQELDSDVAVLPQESRHQQRTSQGSVEDARYVDIGSIETNPKIDYTKYTSIGRGLFSKARVEPDSGRIVISLDLKQALPDLPPQYAKDVNEFAVDKKEWNKVPKGLKIVIMIVGSRGDVQPYLALGKRLIQHGHRVRIASHGTFRSFVTQETGNSGLEFYDIGGDPKELMSYMVKNPGLMPGIASLTNGDIGRKRKMLAEMLEGCWHACHAPCPETGMSFAADAIISNPPAFAHIHCAEALGLPLLMSFTMPWSPTTSFPHPLVNIKESNANKGLTNYLSYTLADILTWQGVGDLVNKFRTKTLGLEPLSLRSGPGLVDTVKCPWTYCMSPALVPKPEDWKNYIDVVGFYFLDLATDYTPPEDLARFLAAGEPPVYIGFGSVPVEDPEKMTQTIFNATSQAGVRALVSAGWGGLGGVSIPSHIFILGNVPHDWLFDKNRVTAVVHHGGAGTTAVGLAKGLPTVVVPFFGDQGFWGSMIHRAGAGPAPIPHKELNVDNLREAIKFAIGPSAKNAARWMAEQIRNEDGVTRGVESFYRHLPLKNMRCDLDPSRVAVWWSTDYCLKLSAFAAQTLIEARQLNQNSLDLHRPKEYQTRRPVTDPVTGGASAIFWTVTHYYGGIAQIFYSPVQGIINTTTAIPRGLLKIFTSVHEGFHNAPKLYGSEVRESGPVNDFSSGLKEAGKGFFYGYYDGITGLVKEPIRGAKKEGFVGAIKGSARSFVNVTMRPAAGIVGLFTHPIQGAWKSVQSSTGKQQEQQYHKTRVLDGVEAVRKSSSWERQEILRLFKEAKGGTDERKLKMKELTERALKNDGELEEVDSDSSEGQMHSELTAAQGSVPPTSSFEQPSSTLVDEDDEAEMAFQRDLEKAKQLSLVEK